MKRDLISKLAMIYVLLFLKDKISSTKEKESLTEYWLVVKGARSGTKNLTNLCPAAVFSCIHFTKFPIANFFSFL